VITSDASLNARPTSTDVSDRPRSDGCERAWNESGDRSRFSQNNEVILTPPRELSAITVGRLLGIIIELISSGVFGVPISVSRITVVSPPRE